jgi:hypothetical protein
MKDATRIFAVIAGLILTGCSYGGTSSGLRTQAEPGTPGCYDTTDASGQLFVNATGGTSIRGTYGSFTGTAGTIEVVWPHHYSARSVGDQLEVLDPTGRVVATTGQQVSLPGGTTMADGYYMCG